MSKVIFLFALVLVAVAAVPWNTCQEKPCTKELNPVSIITSDLKCQEFLNLCFLENAIRCNRISSDVVCMEGGCGSSKVFQCPTELSEDH